MATDGVLDVSRVLDRAARSAATGRHADAERLFRRVLDAEPRNVGALRGLAALYLSKCRWRESLDVYQRLHDVDPDDDAARRMVATLAGGSSSAAVARHVAAAYDGYADGYDRHLLGELDYRAPAMLAGLTAEKVGRPTLGRVLDLGCGTGLFGAALKRRADVHELVGIDLSRRMIEKAAEKGLYDELRGAGILEYLGGGAARFDLVAACDVFVYIGDLSPVFAAVRARIAERGHFCFSVERAEGERFALRRTGRYAHGRTYLDRLAGQHAFREVGSVEGDIRRESGRPVAGVCMVLRAGGAPAPAASSA